MRTVIILTMSAAAWAQQAPSPCQTQENAVQRYKQLAQNGIVSLQQPQVEEALAQCQERQQERQAQIHALKAQELAYEARLAEMRRTYKDTYPEVQLQMAKLAELHAQEAALTQGLQRVLDTQASLKQASGGLQTGLPDRWWKNQATAQSLGLTADQQKKMDEVFQQYRLKLVDLNAVLEKEEVTLEPLVGAGSLDESKITTQIDRVAQARAELEKANGRMLLGIRKLLTPDQWSKLNSGKPL